MEGYGGVGLRRRARPAELEGGVVCMTCQHFTYEVDQHCHTMIFQPQAEAAAPRAAPKALQALGTHLAEGSGLAPEAG